MDYSHLGSPFADTSHPSFNTDTMDYSHLGSPFVVNPAGEVSQIRVIGVIWESVNKFVGTDSNKINKIAGVIPN